jgi:predicted O-methyltransferase YrrM
LKQQGLKIDCLFIDGDKESFEVDFNMYLPLMSPNGIVFMHDINPVPPCSPRSAFLSVKSRGYLTQEIIDTTDAIDALIRQRKGVEPKNPYEAWLRTWGPTSCGVGVIYLDEGLKGIL